MRGAGVLSPRRWFGAERRRWEREGAGFIAHDTTGWRREDHLALRDYLEAHALLPEHPEAVPVEELGPIARRLSSPGAADQEKRRVLMLLAHHKSPEAAEMLRRYLERPDPRVERFARLALEEATQWTAASPHRLGRSDPCPCASGRKLKDCCGRSLSGTVP